MHAKFFTAAVALVALAAPRSAPAQDFGLDLTREGPDLQPSIAVVTASSADAPELPGSVPTSLAQLATKTGLFSKIASAEETKERLSKEGAPRADCREALCLLELAHGLETDRVILALAGPEELRLMGYDWGSGALVEAAVPNDALAGAGAGRALEAAAAPVLQRLSTPLGELVVESNVETAEVRWGGRVIGKGASVQAAVPAGTQPVRVTAEGYASFEREETVPSAGRAEVEATLREQAVAHAEDEFDRPKPKAPPGKPIWKRPGFLTAAGGAAVATLGLIVGGGASSVNSRMVDANGNGVYDVTRADVLAGQRSATWANVLGVTGLAASGAGAAWLYMDLRAPAGEPHIAVTTTGTGVSIHGAF